MRKLCSVPGEVVGGEARGSVAADERSITTLATFPYQLLLCFRIDYYYVRINFQHNQAKSSAGKRAGAHFRINYYYDFVSNITMIASTIRTAVYQAKSSAGKRAEALLRMKEA